MKRLKVIPFIFLRCYLLYALIGLVLFLCIDHQKVIFRTLDYLHDPPQYIMSIAKGEARAFKAKLRDGIRYYKNIIKLFPQSATAYNVLGYCYYQLGEYDRAIMHFQKSIELDPELFGVHYNLGMAYYRHGRYQKAAEAFQEALTVKPDKTITYINLVDPNHLGSDVPQKNFIAQRISGLKRGYAYCHKMIKLSQWALLEEGHQPASDELTGLYYYPPTYTMNIPGKKPFQIM